MIRVFIYLVFVLSYLSANSQSLQIFDIDSTDFPVMRAKFFAKNQDKYQLFYLDKEDFVIYENGIEREVLDVTCPDTSKTIPLSSLLAVDVSGSMGGKYLDLATDAARAWLEVLPFENSECAITTFTNTSRILHHFSQNKYDLLSKLHFNGSTGETNFQNAFLQSTHGGLAVLENRKHKRIMILITDGNGEGDAYSIIEKAKDINATIFCVSISPNCPPILKEVSTKTGGAWFENVNDPATAADIYRQIFEYSQTGEPCEIEWLSETACEAEQRNAEFLCHALLAKDNLYYELPYIGLTQLHINPTELEFGIIEPGQQSTKKITVTALGADFDVKNIKCNDPDFSISPKSFDLQKGEKIQLDVTYKSKSRKYKIAKFLFEHSFCDKYFYCRAGDFNTFAQSNSLKVVSPNGNEVYAIGTDTIISWEGTLPSDEVDIALSKDNGQSWNTLAKNAKNMSYKWRAIKSPTSDNCLVKISMKTPQVAPSIVDKYFYGSTELETGEKIIKTRDNNYVVVGRTNLKPNSDPKVPDEYDLHITKIDTGGNVIWKKIYGGKQYDKAMSVYQTSDDGYIIVGYTKSSDGDINDKSDNSYDVFALKVNNNGEKVWIKTYGGTKEDRAFEVVPSKDNGYIISAITYSNNGDLSAKSSQGRSAWTFKIDDSGDIVWQDIFENASFSSANSIMKIENDNYLVIGQTEINDTYLGLSKCGFVRKLNSSGKEVWTSYLNVSNDQNAFAATVAKNGNFVIACINENYFPGKSTKTEFLWLVELNSAGKIENKSKLFGGDQDVIPSEIITNNEGEYIVISNTRGTSGDISHNHGSLDLWITKFSVDKDLIWEYCFGGSYTDEGFSVIESSPGQYLISAYTKSNDGDCEENQQDATLCLVKLKDFDPNQILEDTSDKIFSIMEPTLDAENIDMGKVVVGMHRDSIFTDFVKNNGMLPCKLERIYIDNDPNNVFTAGQYSTKRTLYPGNKQNMSFRFAPVSLGQFSAEVVIKIDNKNITKTITGIGINRDINVLSEDIDFGTVQVFSSKDTTTALIVNTSDREIKIDDMIIDGYSKDHFEVIDFEPFTLSAGKTKEITLKFTPSTIGRSKAFLTINYQGAGSSVLINLKGAGVGARVYASSETANVGEPINIKLGLHQANTDKLSEVVKSFDCIIKFESSILGVEKKENIIKIENDSTYYKIHGEVLGNKEFLAEVPLIAMLGKVKETSISINSITWYDENGERIYFDSDFKYGHFTLADVCEQGGTRLYNPKGSVKISNLSPNPASNQIEIDFSVSEKGFTEIILTNLLGENVANLFSEEISDFGERKIVRDVSYLGAGQYILLFKTPTFIERKKIIIVR